MKPFFRVAARALAVVSLFALVVSTILALFDTAGEGTLSVLAYSAIAYVYLMVGWAAFQRAEHVAAGPAARFHAPHLGAPA
ncbi:MAG TPA: hypothetical protein VEX86_08915 [Longimicrobium sp.]|nr:hypothetical protein [Longimicrobium sp.]